MSQNKLKPEKWRYRNENKNWRYRCSECGCATLYTAKRGLFCTSCEKVVRVRDKKDDSMDRKVKIARKGHDKRYHTKDCQYSGDFREVRLWPLPEEYQECEACKGNTRRDAKQKKITCPKCGEKFGSLGNHIRSCDG